MPETELQVLIRAVDEATGTIKQVTSEASRGIQEVGNKAKEAGEKTKTFGAQLKEGSNQLRDLRRTAFLATAALATIIATVQQASKYNKEAKKTFDDFTIATTSLAVTMGQILSPALEAVTKVVSFLRDTIEATVAGFIKLGSFVTEFFSNLSQGPVEAYRRAMEVANIATDQFLQKFEETRANVEGGITLDPIKVVKPLDAIKDAAEAAKERFELTKQVIQDFGSALEAAEVLGKGFAKAAAAVAMSTAIINIAEGITKVWAKWSHVPPVAIALSSLVAATGAIQIATIAAQKFHSGGMIHAHEGLAVDEVPIIAQTGEGILSRRGMAALGGTPQLNALNQGQASSGVSVVINYPRFNSHEEMRNLVDSIGNEIYKQLSYARGF